MTTIRRLLVRASAAYRRRRYRRPLKPGPTTGTIADLLYRRVPLASTSRRLTCGWAARQILPKAER